jgi:hypothetical protein
MPELLYRLPRNIITIFSGRNLLWHALAVVLIEYAEIFKTVCVNAALIS